MLWTSFLLEEQFSEKISMLTILQDRGSPPFKALQSCEALLTSSTSYLGIFSSHFIRQSLKMSIFLERRTTGGADWPFPCDSLSVWKWAGLRILVFGAAWTQGGLGKRRVKGCRSMLWRECHKVSAFQSPSSWIADKILGWFGYQEAGLEIRRWKQLPHPERKKSPTTRLHHRGWQWHHPLHRQCVISVAMFWKESQLSL